MGRRTIPVLTVATALVVPSAHADVWSYDTQETAGITAGLRSGSLVGRTELGGKMAPQLGGFLRRSLSNDFTAELGGSYGRLVGDTYSSDMGLADLRLLWSPYQHRYFEPYGYAGLGVVRFDLDRISAERTASAAGIGWGATMPAGLGVYVPLFANGGIDLSAGYTRSTSDDLNAVRGGGKDAFWTTGFAIVIGDLHPSRANARGGQPMKLSSEAKPMTPMTDSAAKVGSPPVAAVAPAAAAEQRRLAAVEARYLALRDSLATPRPASSTQVLATLRQMVYFQNNRAELDESAQAVLRAKLAAFEANPELRVVITGFASKPGTEGYNMALGLRRAEAAKAFLVAQGIDPIRVEIATLGESEPAVPGTGIEANQANRRIEFRLLAADPYLVDPNRSGSKM